MTREELITNLKYTMKKHEHDRVDTFGTDISLMCKDILNYLEQEPKREKGEWKRCNFWYECTKCGYHRLEDTWYNFCPDCGADMRTETEIWHSMNGEHEMPKGLFDKIYNDADEEDDEI